MRRGVEWGKGEEEFLLRLKSACGRRAGWSSNDSWLWSEELIGVPFVGSDLRHGLGKEEQRKGGW